MMRGRSTPNTVPARAFALVLALATALAACATPAPEQPATRSDAFVACEAPRPEICTREYVPVCAERRVVEGGVERVEQATRSNRCIACSDPEVAGFEPGACGADPIDSPTLLDP